jgi:hypothetical protein
MTVSDYSFNSKVIILDGNGILLALIEMLVLFFSNIWITVSDYIVPIPQ